MLTSVLSIWSLLACHSAPPPPCPDCPTCEAPAPPPALRLDPWEESAIIPIVETLRAGVRLEGERGLGICRGRSRCEQFLGADSGELPPGEYFLRAEVRAPAVGEGWKLLFRVRCEVTVTGPTGETSIAAPIEHEQTWSLPAGAATDGHRIEPLWRIRSPAKGGARQCHYSVQGLRPDGAAGVEHSGSYAVPGG